MAQQVGAKAQLHTAHALYMPHSFPRPHCLQSCLSFSQQLLGKVVSPVALHVWEDGRNMGSFQV